MLESWIKRFVALLDKSAWLLIAPAFALLFWIDAPSATTLAQWSLYALVIAGAAVIISRIVFPHIDLQEWLDSALRDRSVAAAMVCSALIVFVGILMLTLAIWAKP